jgi:hypothetical protein
MDQLLAMRTFRCIVQVLPGYTLGSRDYYAVYPHTRHVASRVRACVCRLYG